MVMEFINKYTYISNVKSLILIYHNNSYFRVSKQQNYVNRVVRHVSKSIIIEIITATNILKDRRVKLLMSS